MHANITLSSAHPYCDYDAPVRTWSRGRARRTNSMFADQAAEARSEGVLSVAQTRSQPL